MGQHRLGHLRRSIHFTRGSHDSSTGARCCSRYSIALFGPYENSPTVGAPWNNVEILRRMLADLGAPFNPSQAVPFVATPVAPGSGLTADQAAALAAIPGLVAAVARIETALKGA